MTARLVALSRSLTTLAVLVATMGGPPLALVGYVGWPLPRTIPTLDGLDHAAQTGISDELVINTLAVLAWITWAQIAIALAAEIAAVARQRPARRLPLFPGVQGLAARLVAGAFLMTSPLHATTVPVLAMPVSLTAALISDTATVTVAPEPTVPTPVEPTHLPPGTPATAELRSVTVGRHDSYWAIAERHFNGDGLRWREIRDLNIGRTMPDGTTITGDSDLLRPGWTLQLPATASDPTGPVPEPTTAAPAGTGEVVVEAGDNFWSLAEDQLSVVLGRPPTDSEVTPYWRDLIDANADRLVEPGNPNLLLPGQHLIAPHPGPVAATQSGPPSPEPPPEPDLETPPPESADPPHVEDAPSTTPTSALVPDRPDPGSPTATSAPARAEPAPPGSSTTMAEPAADTGGNGARVAVAVAGSISGAVAVGTLRALRRRRRQAAHRNPSRAPRPSSDEALHRALILQADEALVAGVGSLLDQLASDLAATGAQCRPRVVQHHTTHIDVLVDRPADPPPGWQSDGLLWSRDLRDQTPTSDETMVDAAPLMVTLGQPEDSGQLYLDLEAEGIVSLTGDPAAVGRLVTAIVTELALTPAADRVNIAVVGDLPTDRVAGLDHISVHQTWDDVAEDVTAWAEQTHHAHTTNQWPNTFIARGVAPDHDAAAPLVVIADRPPPDPLLQHVLQHRPASIALVIAAELDQPATVIDCQPNELTVPALGLTCAPHALEPDTVEAIVDLLDDAAEPVDQPLIVTPDPPIQLALDDPDEGTADEPDATLDVLVRFLGDIRVDAPGEHLGAKQTAVIAYIALHRTVTAERLVDAIWAQPSPGSRKRLANTISDCRAVIGHRYLPTAIDGRYSAAPALHSDIDLFTHLVERARSELPPDAAGTLRVALDLVTGPVFTYRHNDRASFSWVDLENLASLWELKVAAVAQRCAELYLDLDEPDDAAAVAHRALTIIPTHSELTGTLMRAHAAGGDDHAVRRVYQAHLAALAVLDLDDPDESVTALYDLLRQGAPASA